MSSIEKTKREHAALKGARKSKRKRQVANIKRLRSIKKRPNGEI